jgi:hypothetical protein
MKSTMRSTSHTGMIIIHARFHPDKSGQVLTSKNQLYTDETLAKEYQQ